VKGAAVGAHRPAPARPAQAPTGEEGRELEMLERAVERLQSRVSKALGRGRSLQGQVETELFAIMGELAVGLVREATARAERLADTLAATGTVPDR
jgi:hypothetical protein